MRRFLTLLIICISALLCITVAAYADEDCEHELAEWVTDREATCTVAGSQYKECPTCYRIIEVKEIPIVPHKWSDWIESWPAYCSGEGQEYRFCETCNVTEYQPIPATGKHEWGSWDTITSATIFRAGVRERYCYNCDASQRGTIAKLTPFAKFTAKKYTVYKGKTKQMKSVLGLATGDAVKSWKSSKKKVVSITKTGKIKAKKKGTAKITVTLKSGKKATCTIKVVKKPKKSSAKTVYITRTGKRYHCDQNCWGLRNAYALYKVSLSTAKGKGLTPCHVCY